MTMFQSMSKPLRFASWLGSTLPVALGVDALGYLLPASGLKFNLLMALQALCNVVVGWLFGMIRFQNAPEIGVSILVIILALAMPAILLVVAIASTLFCGIDACGQ